MQYTMFNVSLQICDTYLQNIEQIIKRFKWECFICNTFEIYKFGVYSRRDREYRWIWEYKIQNDNSFIQDANR